MKVAVTGATGFIGKHVLSELAKYPVEIVAISRQASVDLTPSQRMKVIRFDLENASPDSIKQIGNPDVLIHLAWGGLPNYSSMHHFERELPMHYFFLKTMIKAGLKSLFVAGTCFEYGMQSGPLSESMIPRPNNSYGFAKDTLRRQLEYLKTHMPFSLTWGRLFYLYGHGQSDTSLLPQLRRAVQRGDSIFHMSSGEQLRDYLSVTDAARDIVSLALQSKDIGIVNICSGKPVSVRKQVENWIAENAWKIKLDLGYYPYPDYEPMAFWGDRRKIDSCMEPL
ncbi:MAG: NAD(P)-dependent oxidoreductase [Proteobacteria bacterium]|nr:NAD-dependent epimerase/dehydratase family protein [Desulfobacula sp.]MBU3952646.1 NAD(P)-dependent oxidoreductase [Pseudomonadota bacterium]MBU4133596.1 NAD(P)-dependent oxidoreductase [Pseudomonadota bacterium]